MADIERHGDEPLLLALARGLTVRDAASEANVSETTAFRRLRDQTFVRRLTAARAELWSTTLGRLAAAATQAVDRLVMLVDEADSDSVRLAAAKAVFDIGSKLRADIETDARLRALEGSNDEIGRAHV